MGHLTYACRSTGESCEWALEADSPEVILQRVADHEKCAHKVPELSDDQRRRISAAIRAV
jgi:predicted small metal-binding protein